MLRITKAVSGGGVRVELVVDSEVTMVVHSADYPHDATVQLDATDVRDIRDALSHYLDHHSL
jgi:hypothetical protein